MKLPYIQRRITHFLNTTTNILWRQKEMSDLINIYGYREAYIYRLNEFILNGLKDDLSNT